MSITAADFATNSATPADSRHTARRTAAAGAAFAELLGQTRQGAEVPAPPAELAATAAEALRLEMLQSALSLGEQESTPTLGFARRALQEILRNMAPEGQDSVAPGQNSAAPAEETAGPPPPAPPQVASSREAPLGEIIRTASRRFGVDEGLIRAVIKAESNFNPNAVSHAGAQGLMQLMPATARGLGVTDSFDPLQNVMAGTRFLKDMLTRYGGNLDAALAAYNWGPGNVDRKGMALPRETREYLTTVKKYYTQLT